MPPSTSAKSKQTKKRKRESRSKSPPQEEGEDEELYTFASTYKLSKYDVMCGRNKVSETHKGNHRFRDIVNEWSQEYSKDSLSREDHKRIISIVYDKVDSHGGYFLKQDFEESEFMEIPRKFAREKIAHALRDAGVKFLKDRAEEQEQLRRQQGKKKSTKSKSTKGHDHDKHRSKNNHKKGRGRVSENGDDDASSSPQKKKKVKEKTRKKRHHRGPGSRTKEEVYCSTSPLSSPHESSAQAAVHHIAEEAESRKSVENSVGTDCYAWVGYRRKRPRSICKPRKKPKPAGQTPGRQSREGSPTLWVAPGYQEAINLRESLDQATCDVAQENSRADSSLTTPTAAGHEDAHGSTRPSSSPSWKNDESNKSEQDEKRKDHHQLQQLLRLRETTPSPSMRQEEEQRVRTEGSSQSLLREAEASRIWSVSALQQHRAGVTQNNQVLASRAGVDALASHRQRVLAALQGRNPCMGNGLFPENSGEGKLLEKLLRAVSSSPALNPFLVGRDEQLSRLSQALVLHQRQIHLQHLQQASTSLRLLHEQCVTLSNGLINSRAGNIAQQNIEFLLRNYDYQGVLRAHADRTSGVEQRSPVSSPTMQRSGMYPSPIGHQAVVSPTLTTTRGVEYNSLNRSSSSLPRNRSRQNNEVIDILHQNDGERITCWN